MPMVTQLVIDANGGFMGGDAAGECNPGSPGSGGASPYPELRPPPIAIAGMSHLAEKNLERDFLTTHVDTNHPE
jgi:hypothetical protein